MTIRQASMLTIGALACLVALPDVTEAQIGSRIRDRARQATERRVEQRADQAVDRVIDKAEETVACLISDTACIEGARSDGHAVVVSDASGNVVAEHAASAVPPTPRPGEGAWANFDFVTGDRTMFTEDFTRDRVGNFPQRLEMIRGNMEIIEWQGGRYLRGTAESSFDIVLPEVLPERFTIEFDLFDPTFWATFVYAVDDTRKPEQHTRAYFAFNNESGLVLGNPSVSSATKSSAAIVPQAKMMRVSIMADGQYMKVFLDEHRISNMPRTDFPRTNRIRFELPSGSSSEKPVLVGNIRIAAGGSPLYDALEADGRVSTQGIMFDSGSDRIRPESTPTLAEIGAMLKRHADLRLTIEGHTDAVGHAPANQALSERRAAAVRLHLVDSYGIDAARLQAVGKGSSEPAASNETPEGRQNNRRVVLVRQ